ncbi:hypothetical protein H8S23_05095 [Anaerofilum sp. BX8]|uniref:Lyzozyme M1 (1,4-beta-N-acetylmuramidase), GH25 family n=1 Tax=Anaerofilum hominis TaxID=2763016 RepID=A0A923I9R0_9FIRM|nr:GH25 family lysozyme [Anaerofilum hominis]MBC5580873.1 hypothetical protein [Anaerofilum hominis]
MELKGIDVSKYQGEINWPRVAASGVQFAFVRVGWAGYEGGIDEGRDPYFAQNMRGALDAGLAVGAYVYSYCKTANAARRAAREAAALLAPYRLTMPLAFDMEDAATYKPISKGDNSIVAAAFLDEVRALGHYPMLYTYTSFANSCLDMDALSGYDLWLADYRGYMGIQGAGIWQYSSSGRVAGIAGRVDLNIAYKDYPALIGGHGWTADKKEDDGVMQFLEAFGERRCECFSRPDVNAVDKSYNNGTLASGTYYPLMADCGRGADGFHWVRVLAGGSERYAAVLDDRCRITGLSAGDAVWAVQAQSAGGDAAVLENKIAELRQTNTQLTARAATAETKAEQAQDLADGYLARIKAASAALEV